MLSNILFTAILASVAIANPTPRPASNSMVDISARDTTISAASVLLAVAATSATCSGTECATNVQASNFLPEAMVKYGVYNVYEISAIIATQAFESADFKFNTNQYPGRPGQGTRNMQMANFNLMYAASIPELKAPLAAITTATSVTGLSNDTLNAIRALVLPDAYCWGSGPWFYTTQCSKDVQASVQTGTLAGWNAFLGCVGVTDTDGTRTAKWSAALKAFGLAVPTS